MLKLAYADADPKGTARRALIGLYQTNKSIEVFWAEFHRLSQKACMDSEMALEYLKDRLSNEIKDRLVNIHDTGMDLATFMEVVQAISTKLDVLGKQRVPNTNRTNPAVNINKPFYKQASAPVVPTVSTTVSSSSPSTATGTHAGPMDISFAGKHGPFTPEEKERRSRLNPCRFCGQAGHIAEDHNDSGTLQAKRRAADIHELAISSENVSSSSTDTTVVG